MEIKHRTQLVELLKHFNLPLVAVECGVAEGLNSRDLIVAGIKMLYMVDNWATIPGHTGDGGNDQAWHDKNYQEAIERVKGGKGKATPLRGMSVAMADYVANKSVGLVYVDDDHSEKGVESTIGAWWPKLVNGGIMAFHDYWEELPYGVHKVVNAFAKNNNLELHFIPENQSEDSGVWIQKPIV